MSPPPLRIPHSTYTTPISNSLIVSYMGGYKGGENGFLGVSNKGTQKQALRDVRFR